MKLFILAALTFSQLVFAAEDSGAVAYCNNPKVSAALQVTNWFEKNYYYNQYVRHMTLDESKQIQRVAKIFAVLSTLVFLLSLALFMGGVSFVLTTNKMFSIGLGAAYFFFFLGVIYSSTQPITETTQEFKMEVLSIRENLPPEKVQGPSVLQDFVASVTRETIQVSQAFHERSKSLPESPRWWTLGWDDVALIEFQNEALAALIKKGHFGIKGVSIIKADLKRRCLEGLIQI